MYTNSRVYYSDRDSGGMLKKRKRDLRFRYIAVIVGLSGYSFLLIGYIVNAWRYSFEATIGITFLWTIVLFFMITVFYYVFIKIHRRALRYGIVLTDESLSVYGDELSLSSILRAKIVNFGPRSGIFLAIDYEIPKRGKREIKTRLLWPSEAENIYELCDRLRELKGWPKQTYIPACKWRDWRRSLKEMGR